jgi:hypothetical protein
VKGGGLEPSTSRAQEDCDLALHGEREKKKGRTGEREGEREKGETGKKGREEEKGGEGRRQEKRRYESHRWHVPM